MLVDEQGEAGLAADRPDRMLVRWSMGYDPTEWGSEVPIGNMCPLARAPIDNVELEAWWQARAAGDMGRAEFDEIQGWVRAEMARSAVGIVNCAPGRAGFMVLDEPRSSILDMFIGVVACGFVAATFMAAGKLFVEIVNLL